MQKIQLHKIIIVTILSLCFVNSAQSKSKNDTFLESDLANKLSNASKSSPKSRREGFDMKSSKDDPRPLGRGNSPSEKVGVAVSGGAPQKSTLTDELGTGGGIASILLGAEIKSLMFDDEEIANIDRAVESLKNNQIYIPTDDESQKNLTEEEKKKKEEEDKKKSSQSEDNEKSYIYLASIIYFTPKDWAIWINQQKITPETNKPTNEFYLTSVKKDSVKILWKLSLSKWKILSAGSKNEGTPPATNKDNQVEIEFELQQNQTFVLSSRTVVEGRAVVAILKKKEDENKAKAAAVINGDKSSKTRLSPR
jgi:hypothetical protein